MSGTIQRTKNDIESCERMRKMEAAIQKAVKIRGITMMEYLSVLAKLQYSAIEMCRKEESK